MFHCRWGSASRGHSKSSKKSSKMRGVTYAIRSSLYVAVTNRCCTTSLIASRGPGISMPPSFQPLPGEFEPSAEEVIEDVAQCLRGGAFEEVVFAGVGEPLLRWHVVKEVVKSLRSRHAELLEALPDNGGSSSTDTGKRQTKTTTGQNEAPGPAAGSLKKTIKPLRLATNGLWPAALAATTTAGTNDHPLDSIGRRRGQQETIAAERADFAAAAQDSSSSTGMQLTFAGEERTKRGNDGPAAALAKEVAELFDSVSVALNTADPAQYEQLMKPSIDGLRPQDAHAAVCDVVSECVARGLPTECTVVDRQGVDVESAQELAARLGASCRVRPYFP